VPYNIIVTVKQVPDTKHISGEAMKADGTVNRAALPAIFNPEDLNALEEALAIKEIHGGHVTALSMGPPTAEIVLKECLFRGADEAILLSDRKFAGADTLATSYALACAIRRIGAFDMIFCGRQAIDGDTAQVGPQIAEKLAINQVTCTTQILELTPDAVTAVRSLENGRETVQAALPVLLTISAQANEPRSFSAKRVMALKSLECLHCQAELKRAPGDEATCTLPSHIRRWDIAVIGADPDRCGLSGSPTKVKKVENVVLKATDMKKIQDTPAGIACLVKELVDDNILG
jgi:electron transfer flavoprotein beta subunit